LAIVKFCLFAAICYWIWIAILTFYRGFLMGWGIDFGISEFGVLDPDRLEFRWKGKDGRSNSLAAGSVFIMALIALAVLVPLYLWL